MSEFLSQEEVDALLKGVSGETDEPVEDTPTEGPRPYNLATQERIVKRSGRWYAEVTRENRVMGDG